MSAAVPEKTERRIALTLLADKKVGLPEGKLTLGFAPARDGMLHVHVAKVKVPERDSPVARVRAFDDGRIVVSFGVDGRMVSLELLDRGIPADVPGFVKFAKAEKDLVLLAAYATAMIQWARLSFWLSALNSGDDEASATQRLHHLDAEVIAEIQRRYLEAQPDANAWKMSGAQDPLALTGV